MDDVATCPSCGIQVGEHAYYCQHCGVHLASGDQSSERFSSERLDAQRRERVMVMIIIILIVIILALLAYPSVF